LEDDHKNIIIAGIFLIAVIITYLLSEDILKSLFLGILVAIIVEIGLSKYKNEENYNSHIVTENKINTKPIENDIKIVENISTEPIANNTKIVNWKSIFTGLVISGILLAIIFFTPPSIGITELSGDASILFLLLMMGAVFLGGAVVGYMSHSDESGLISSVIFATILGLLMALLDPFMLIFAIPGPIGGIIGIMVSKILK